MVSANPYHSASFFHSSNQLTGNIYTTRKNFTDYFQLKKLNTNLAEENAKLRNEKNNFSSTVIISRQVDSTKIPDVPFAFHFISAKVINNSVHNTHNHFTLNKGEKHGIERGMGVISSNGVVGVIRSVSANFSTAYSLLNNNVLISSQLKNKETLCTVNWNGNDPAYANLLYVPRHVQLNKGDSIITSGFNAVFPEKILIGVIDDFSLKENSSFYSIKVKLSSDFYGLSYVYVVNNNVFDEKINLENSGQDNE